MLRVGLRRMASIGFMRFLAGLSCVVSVAPIAHAALFDRVGAMGDSLTDESWQIEPGLLQHESYVSWVEQLVDSGRVSFGAYGNWSWPRNTGYEYNFACAGSTTDVVISEGQHTGLAACNPTLAFFNIGGNDLVNHMKLHSAPALGGDGQDPAVLLPQMIADFDTAFETVAGTLDNPTATRMVLATVPDLSRCPLSRYLDPMTYPGTMSKYRSATNAFNDHIKAVAAERSIPVVDLFAMFDGLLGPIDNPHDTFMFGGVDMLLYPISFPCAPTDTFLSDGFHPGTVMHGLMANMFMYAVNSAYGTTLAPLSEQDILLNAGVTSPASGPTYFDVSRFVIVPEPTAALLMMLGVPLLLRRR